MVLYIHLHKLSSSWLIITYCNNAFQIADILKINSQSLSTKYCSGLDASADAEINYDVYELIHKLLLHIHQNEPDVSKSILVFLPTYYALEQQWIRLFPFSSTFKVHILHRSIDTDEALQTMKISKSCRKVHTPIFLSYHTWSFFLPILASISGYVVPVARNNDNSNTLDYFMEFLFMLPPLFIRHTQISIFKINEL